MLRYAFLRLVKHHSFSPSRQASQLLSVGHGHGTAVEEDAGVRIRSDKLNQHIDAFPTERLLTSLEQRLVERSFALAQRFSDIVTDAELYITFGPPAGLDRLNLSLCDAIASPGDILARKHYRSAHPLRVWHTLAPAAVESCPRPRP